MVVRKSWRRLSLPKNSEGVSVGKKIPAAADVCRMSGGFWTKRCRIMAVRIFAACGLWQTETVAPAKEPGVQKGTLLRMLKTVGIPFNPDADGI